MGVDTPYLLDLGLTEFAFNPTQETAKASQEFVSGSLVTAEEVAGATTYRFSLSWNRQTWQRQGFHLNQKDRARSVLVPTDVVTATVPSSGSFEIEDAYITSTNDTQKTIQVAVTSSGAWGQSMTLTRTTNASTAPSASGQVQVDTTNHKLVFHSAQAGATVKYVKFDYYDVRTYGGPTGITRIGEFEYFGRVYVKEIPTPEIFHVPKAEIVTIPSFTINNGVPTVTVECSMTLPSGWDDPWEIINMYGASATA